MSTLEPPPTPERQTIRCGTGPHDGMVIEVTSSSTLAAALIITEGAPTPCGRRMWHYEVGTVEGVPAPPARAVADMLRLAAHSIDGRPPG